MEKYIYIVMWTISQHVACPSPPPDEFGRQSITTNSVACFETIDKKRSFFNRDSAVAFFDRGNFAMPNQFEIDSVKLKTK